MKWLLSLLLAGFAAAGFAKDTALPVRSAQLDSTFMIIRNGVTVMRSDDDADQALELASYLRDNGVLDVRIERLKKKHLKKPSALGRLFSGDKARIVLMRRESFDNVPPQGVHPFAITVKEGTCTIEFSDEAAAVKALDVFKKMCMALPSKEPMIYLSRGVVVDWGSAAEKGVVAVTGNYSLKQIEKHVRETAEDGIRTVYLALNYADSWCLESGVCRLINPNEEICSGKPMPYSDLNALYATCRGKYKAELVPMIDLFSSNLRFETATGHSVESSEGNTFLKFVFDEFCRNCSAPVVCVGYEKDAGNTALLPVLEYVAEYYGKQVVLLNE